MRAPRRYLSRLGHCALVLTATCAGLVGVTGCPGTPNVFPSSSPCPPIATTPPYYPPPAARAPTTSINFELSSEYMLPAMVEPAVESSDGPSGIHVRTIMLSEQGSGASATNLITLTIVPWLRNAQGQQVEVSTRSFDLTLQITPYLVTKDTVPDPSTLHEILGAQNNEGLVLRFDFVGLRDDGTGAQVTCSSTDPIAQPVLVGILTKLGTQTPTILTTDKLVGIANTLTPPDSPVTLQGVNVGTDGSLKLGFAFNNLPSNSQGAEPFDPTPLVIKLGLWYQSPAGPSCFLQSGASTWCPWNWNLDIAQGFMSAAIKARAAALLRQVVPDATVPNATTNFTGSGIGVTLYGSANSICGSFNFSVTSTVTPQIGMDPAGNSVLQLPATPPNFDPGTGQGFKAGCYAVEKTFFGGYSVATIKQDVTCGDVTGDPVELTTPSGDTLFGTSIDTEYDFVILGRSKLLDSLDGVRTVVPPCSP
jgi:hypothetical protein